MTRPQAVPLSQILSQMRLFSLASYFRRTAALTCSSPLWEGLTEQWPNIGCTRNTCWTLLLLVTRDCGQVPACPRKSSQDSVAAVFSGIRENHNTHLAPDFALNGLVPAPANVAVFWGLLGPSGFNSLYQMSFQQWNRFSLCGLRTSWTPTLFLGIRPSHQSTASYGAVELQTLRSPCLQS